MRLSESGIATVYKSRQYGGEYNYTPVGVVATKEPVAAFEVRYLLFDMWGQHMRTLSATQVKDSNGQVPLKDIGAWTAWENDVSGLLTVVSFVSRVRMADGRIWNFDSQRLLNEVQRIKVKLTEQQLTPEREKPKS